MFRQLTGGLESVVRAIVDQMPSNVTLTTDAIVQDISYADAVYHYHVNSREETSDMMVISTPPATYKDWFTDDAGFDGVRNMDNLVVLLQSWPLIKRHLTVTLKVQAY